MKNLVISIITIALLAFTFGCGKQPSSTTEQPKTAAKPEMSDAEMREKLVEKKSFYFNGANAAETMLDKYQTYIRKLQMDYLRDRCDPEQLSTMYARLDSIEQRIADLRDNIFAGQLSLDFEKLALNKPAQEERPAAEAPPAAAEPAGEEESVVAKLWKEYFPAGVPENANPEYVAAVKRIIMLEAQIKRDGEHITELVLEQKHLMDRIEQAVKNWDKLNELRAKEDIAQAQYDKALARYEKAVEEQVQWELDHPESEDTIPPATKPAP